MIGKPAGAPPPTVAFRRSGTRWLQVAVIGIPALIFLSGIGVSSTHGWEKIANAVGLLACVALGVRIARVGIFAGPDKLLVRNYFTTYRVGWRDISAFGMPPAYGTLRKTGLRIHLADGRLVSASAYTLGPLDSRRAARTAVTALEELRRQRAPDSGAAQQARNTVSGEEPDRG